MIVISMVLVVVGFVTLMLGVLDVTEEPLNFVYTSIGACILAGVFLIAGVLRSRPSRQGAPPSPAPGASVPGPGGPAAPGGTGQQTEPLPRDGASAPTAPPPAPPSTPSGSDPGSRPLDSWRPQTYSGSRGGPSSRPPAAPGPTRGRFGAKPEPEPEPDVDDELEDVGDETEAEEAPRAEAHAGEGAVAEDEDAVAETPPAVPKKTAKKAAKKGGTKKAGAKKATKKASTKKSAAKKAGTKKAGTKKAGAKKASAKKQAQTSAAQDGDETRRIANALSGVQGCGLAKHRKLAERFGSYEGLTEASVAQIAEVEGVSQALAKRIHERLHS